MQRLKVKTERYETKFNFCLSKSQHEKLQAMADRLGVNCSTAIRLLIEHADLGIGKSSEVK